VITDAERPALEAAFSPEELAAWEAAGSYLGWRAGFDADGPWRFMTVRGRGEPKGWSRP